MLATRHIFSSFSTLGGVEAILSIHLEHDAEYGLESKCIVTFDRPDLPQPRATSLACSGFTSVAQARQRFRRVAAEAKPALFIYHNLWGLRVYGPLDEAHRRLGYIHSNSPPGLNDLCELSPFVDGVICASHDLAETARSLLPGFEGNRILGVDYPLPERIFSVPLRPAHLTVPLVVGYSGRLVQEQKQVRDIPRFLSQLKRLGVDFRFEVLGDGVERSWLESALRGWPQVRFHGRKSGEEYWRIIAGWDVIFSCSAYETGPISLLEGLALGVLPLCPDMPCMANPCVRRVDARLLYPPGDCAAAAQALAGCLAEWRGQSGLELRRRCRAAVAPHTLDQYMQRVTGGLRRIAEFPRVAQQPVFAVPKIQRLLPVGIVGRLRRFLPLPPMF